MNKIILVAVLSFLLVSCTTARVDSLNYLNNLESVATEKALENKNPSLQIGDELIIIVNARDQDVVKPFNKNYSSSAIIQESGASKNTIPSAQQNFVGPTYVVDSNNQIDFPLIGTVDTKGKTILDLKNELEKKISTYVKNPTVNIRITNFRITVLGEVSRPGDYTVASGKATVLNALGLAGDLTIYGNRDDVLILRTVDGVVTKKRIDVQDANFINSDFYELKQNDVILVSANKTKQKTAKLDPNTPIYISVAGILVTIIALIFR
ncbi:polysaccharide biosynthesis/export family protein [Halpernia frigidisoli]|uniref:Polysaccharide export outer membrane protein n=1 Tax=Halpernia frigidisoli TaxID=1125876 RepID=A0A1I3FDM3_9FLAO|nr:polysaccharide biosynthesis/export family protein [Halpernia frigidisoli]SFI09328.1 polysaccharide export outer membrane protein [Halpernia frigidisoli]